MWKLILASNFCFSLLAFAELPRNDHQQSHRWRLETFAAANDYIADVTSDTAGNIYIAGSTDGSLPSFTNAGGLDAFVAKFNASGVLQWVRQLGTSSEDALYSVSVSSTGIVYAGGYTGGAFPTRTNAGGNDAFAVSFSSVGVQNWLIQFGTTGNDIIYAATRDSTRNPIFAGSTSGAFPTFANAGGLDMFVTERARASGNQSWMRQMGTASNDEVFAVQIDSSNRTYAAGYTEGAFPTYTNAGLADAYLAQLSAAGAITWQRQYGTTGDDFTYTLPCRSNGTCYPAGLTGGTWAGNTSAGLEDAWVASYTAAGARSWIRQFGSSKNDSVRGGRMDASNRPNLVGVTAGALPGFTSKGANDIFFVRYSTAGVADPTAKGQNGTTKADFACASGVTNIGASFPVGGYSSAAYTGYSILKGIDSYIMNFNTTNGALSVLNQFGTSN